MNKKIVLLGILMLVLFQVSASAKTRCQICSDVKESLFEDQDEMGWSDSEIYDVLDGEGCCDCEGICPEEGSCCGTTAIILAIPFCCLFGL